MTSSLKFYVENVLYVCSECKFSEHRAQPQQYDGAYQILNFHSRATTCLFSSFILLVIAAYPQQYLFYFFVRASLTDTYEANLLKWQISWCRLAIRGFFAHDETFANVYPGDVWRSLSISRPLTLRFVKLRARREVYWFTTWVGMCNWSGTATFSSAEVFSSVHGSSWNSMREWSTCAMRIAFYRLRFMVTVGGFITPNRFYRYPTE